MKIKRIFFSLFVLLIFNLVYASPATNSEPGSIERYTWIGGNNKGTIVAFILSYFGPSSRSPIAKLIIKKADEVEPLYTDSAMRMDGGEKELAELVLYLVEKNTEHFNVLGIKLSNDFISEANVVIPGNNNPTISSGWVEIQSVGLRPFEVKTEKGEPCAYDPNLNSFGLEFWFDQEKKITVPSNANNCGLGNFMIRNIFRTKQALWFIIYQHAYGLGPVDTWWIDVEGIKY